MKKTCYLLILFVSANLFAQTEKNNLPKPGVISGKVIDNTSKEPLPYVNIVIKNDAKEIITGGITDDKGAFKINGIPLGASFVELQFIGYEMVTKQITITKETKKITLETVALNEDSTSLNEVFIRAETSTVVQKVDRKVINVGKDLTAAGATASELLNNVQSVSVDSQTGAISLRGNDNVRVLVDGKPTNISTAQLLKQIPSTSIKSVELITNPSAKYNPEGMSGIINIILNKNANLGFNGAVNSGVTAGHFVRYNASTNMNYKKGNINFFGNYGYNGGDNYNFGFVERPASSIYQDFVFLNINQSHLLKLGADIYLNDKNTLSFYTTQNKFSGGGSGSAIISQNGAIISNAPNVQNQKNSTGTYNLNYKIEFDKKDHNLEFEATYSNTTSPEDAINNDLTRTPSDIDYRLLNYFNDIENERNNTLINIDYTNPISENGKLELGLEYRTNKTKNINLTNQESYSFDVNSNVTGTEPLGDSSFDYDRKIYSGYANYNHKFGKLSMQLGARLEQYEIIGNFTQNKRVAAPVTDNIFSVYPSTFFTYAASEKNQWQLSYSRRVDRPGIQQVNPIREWSTPLITSIGNPNLVPQFTNSFEVNYTRQIEKGSITFGTFYRKVNDVISRITKVDPLDPNKRAQILSFTNFEDTSAYGFEASANYKVANWWRINSSLDFYSQKQIGNINLTATTSNKIEVVNQVFNARISNSFKASKDLSFQLFAMYRGPQKDIQWDVKSMWMVNLGGSLTVLKGKGTVSFRVNDIFKGMKFAFDSTNPYVQKGKFNWESRTTFLGFNYRFGGGKNKAKRRRNRDNNEKSGGGFF